MTGHRTSADREPNRIAIVEIDGEEKAVELCNWFGSKGWGWCRASGGRDMWAYDGDMQPLSPGAPPVVRVLEWVSICVAINGPLSAATTADRFRNLTDRLLVE